MTKISLICTRWDCGAEVMERDVVLPQVDISAESGDAEQTQAYGLICPECGAAYDVEVTAHTAGHSAKVVGADLPVSIDPEEYSFKADDWDDIEAHPHSVYLQADAEVRKLALWPPTVAGTDSFFRMLFVHLFSMVEAYLADTLIGLSERNDEVRRALVLGTKGLRDIRVDLSEAERGAAIVKDRVRAFLRQQQFHKFAFVDAVYLVAMGRGILPSSDADRDALFAAVGKRHDCVHRNGRDAEGNLHVDIDVDYVLRLANRFLEMVNLIEASVEEIDERSNRQFRQPRTFAGKEYDDDLPF